MAMTITEALQEIKTINGRLEKKRGALMPYVARDNRARDPFEKSGGSAEHIRAERQSIWDLEQRLVQIRTAIQSANLNSILAVGDVQHTVAEWLTWRRDVSAGQVAFLQAVIRGIQQVRQQVQQKGGRVTTVPSVEINTDATAPPEVVVSVDERKLLEEQDMLQQQLGTLDGKLSLFNATMTIDV